MQADNRHTDMLIAILHTPIGAEVKIVRLRWPTNKFPDYALLALHQFNSTSSKANHTCVMCMLQ